MWTKIDLINLAQKQVTSGKSTADTRGKYSIPAISRTINPILERLCRENPVVNAANARPYTFTPVEDDLGWYVTLDPKPINAIYAIQSVMDQTPGDRTGYRLRDNSSEFALNALYGGLMSRTAQYILPGTIRLSSKPVGAVTVVQTPNVWEMEESDMILAPGFEKQLLDELVFTLRQQDMKQAEFLNNSRVDV